MIYWRPIETAPKDGTAFYVWMPNWNGRGPLVRTAWHSYGWANELLNGAAPADFRPTHWHPLPAPPKDPAQ